MKTAVVFSVLLLSLVTCQLPLTLIQHGMYDLSDMEILQIMEDYDIPNPQSFIQERVLLFRERLEKIIAHNKNPNRKYNQSINKLAFYTGEELSNYLNKMAPQDCSATAQWTLENLPRRHIDVKALPTSVDWRKLSKVSVVKDQGQCGSCWTFSTTGAMEAHWAIFQNTSADVLLSEQQLVDCAGDFNNHGCNGGLPSQAFEYIFYNDGLDTEDSYPYEAYDNDCRFNAKTIGARNRGGVYNITFQNEDELMEQVATVGPVSIAFQVLGSFMGYSEGVYSDPDCSTSPQDVNHAVLVVGYDTTEDGQDYWIVKNSWGDSWGQEGYFLIERGTNMCGISDCASYPIMSSSLQNMMNKLRRE